MWFKQAQLFQLSRHIPYHNHGLDGQLEPFTFKPCLPTLPSSYGWVPPIDKAHSPLVYPANGCLLLCMKIEEKVLPPVIVQQALEDKIKSLLTERNQKVSQKEKSALRDEITYTLLPKAFSKFSKIYAYINTHSQCLVVNSTSTTKIGKFLDLLRKSVRDTTYHPIETKKISQLLTHWLINDSFPQSFSIKKNCLLRDPNQRNRIIRCQEQDLSVAAIHSLLSDGFQIFQLALDWEEKICFNFSDDFTLRKIKYHDEVLNLSKEDYSESEQQKFDSDFVIMTQTLNELFEALLEMFSKNPSLHETTASLSTV